MDYKRIYKQLIEKGKNRQFDGYCEVHHIKPKCLGGDDSYENLVKLTPEEHYLAHQLLMKIFPNNGKLVKAAVMMRANRPGNKIYGWIRREFSKVQSDCQAGELNSQFGTVWITNGLIERKLKNNQEVPIGWKRQRLSSVIVEQQEILKRNKKRTVELRKRELKVEELNALHKIYVEGGFKKVKDFGYKYSKANLVQQFSKYVVDFIPQNGKPR